MKQPATRDQDYLMVIAFPDFYIHYHQVWHRVVWKFLGFTEGNTIRAGHNCVLSVNGNSGKIKYFDFGRYDVPDGYGRARSVETDPQLEVPVIATFADGQISNLEEIIAWFYSRTSIHHSAGPLYCKVLPQISESAVEDFVTETQRRGFVDYDIFRKGALNCSRYVGHLIKAVVPQSRLSTYLKYICPSPTPLDTVINADSGRGVYRYDGSELQCLPIMSPLDGIRYYLKSRGAYHNDTTRVEMPNLHWIGSKAIGSYYSLTIDNRSITQVKVVKYSAKGVMIGTRDYSIIRGSIDLNTDYDLELGETPEQLVAVQGGERTVLERVSSVSPFN